MRGILRLGAGLLTAGLLAAGAAATPTCTTTDNLGPTGEGLVLRSQIVSGFCVLANDNLYGNFNLGNLPKSLVLIFNNNVVGGLTRYQLSFDSTYKIGKSYSWGYEVAVDVSAPPKTVFVSLDSDFTQTTGGPSVLDKFTVPPGTTPPIQVTKIGPDVQSGSILSTSFGPNVTDLVISETLRDRGTISSVTNTVVQFSPPHGPPIPEPATLALMGIGIAGLGVMRKRRRG